MLDQLGYKSVFANTKQHADQPDIVETMFTAYIRNLSVTLVRILCLVLLAWSLLVAPMDLTFPAAEQSQVLRWRVLLVLGVALGFTITSYFQSRDWITLLFSTLVYYAAFITACYLMPLEGGTGNSYSYVIYTAPILLTVLPSSLLKRIGILSGLFAVTMAGATIALGMEPYRLIAFGVIIGGIHILSFAIGYFCFYTLLRRSFFQQRTLRESRQKVKQLAETDPLTGLYRRSEFNEQLSDLMETVQKGESREPLSVLMADLDRFKKINDTYGHDAGDRVLENFAVMLEVLVTNKTRSSDVAGRYGGEEFIVALPETRAENACEVARRLKDEVEQTEFIEGDGVNLTVSIGVSEFQSSDDIDSLTKRADQALYAAKQTRNAVCAYRNMDDTTSD